MGEYLSLFYSVSAGLFKREEKEVFVERKNIISLLITRLYEEHSSDGLIHTMNAPILNEIKAKEHAHGSISEEKILSVIQHEMKDLEKLGVCVSLAPDDDLGFFVSPTPRYALSEAGRHWVASRFIK